MLHPTNNYGITYVEGNIKLWVKNQMLNLIKANNGLITSKEISRHDINRIFLTRLVKSEKIEKRTRNILWNIKYKYFAYRISK